MTELIEDDLLPDVLRLKWTSFLFAGVILVIAGLFATLSPLTSGLTLTTLIGASLCVSGLFQSIHAFAIKSWGWFIASFSMGVILFAAGIFLLFSPLTGVVILTLGLGLAIGASGFAEMAGALWLRPLAGWKWSVGSGVVSVICGIFIWTKYATAAAWLVGLAAGLGLFTTGVTLILLGLAGRRAARQHIA